MHTNTLSKKSTFSTKSSPAPMPSFSNLFTGYSSPLISSPIAQSPTLPTNVTVRRSSSSDSFSPFVVKNSPTPLDSKQGSCGVSAKDDKKCYEMKDNLSNILGAETKMETEERYTDGIPNTLAETIVQKMVSLFYPSQHLLVLLVLQSSKVYMTITQIHEQTNLSLQTISVCLNDLINEKIVTDFAMDPNTNQLVTNPKKTNRKNYIYGYVIDYVSAIEHIVYKTSTLLQKHRDFSLSQKEVVYVCKRDGFCCSYDEAMLYLYEGEFECPECGRVLSQEYKMNVDAGDVDVHKKMEKEQRIIDSLKFIEDDLQHLKGRYEDMKDYPQMTRPWSTNNALERKSGDKETITRRREKVYSNAPMPWEDVEDDVVEELKKEDENEYIDWMNFDFSQMKFLEANKTFVDKVEKVCASPVRPVATMPTKHIIKMNKNNNRKRAVGVMMNQMM